MRKSGFTLIELLVVIAIIGLLSIIAIIVLRERQIVARDARRQADVAAIQLALTMYYEANNSYPEPDEANCNSLPGNPAVFVCSMSGDGGGFGAPPLMNYLSPAILADPGGWPVNRTGLGTYLYMKNALDQSGKMHSYVIFYMLQKDFGTADAQQDFCNMGIMPFDLPQSGGSWKWSTRCPD